MSPFLTTLIAILDWAFHLAVLMIPAKMIPKAIQGSDSLWTVTSSTDEFADFTFGYSSFAINATEDIEFSEAQEDALLGSSHTVGGAFLKIGALLCVASVIVLPLLIAIYRSCIRKVSFPEIKLGLVKQWRFASPVVGLVTVLYLVPLLLLQNAPLCGPNYYELSYEENQKYVYMNSNTTAFVEDSSSDDEERSFGGIRGRGHHESCGSQWMGTSFALQSDVNASCSAGSSTIGLCVFVGVLSLFLVFGEYYLLGRKVNAMTAAAAAASEEASAEEGESDDWSSNVSGADVEKQETKTAVDDGSVVSHYSEKMQIY